MTTQEIKNTLRYCAEHCDDEKETEIVEWVAEKFAERLYVEPHGPKGRPKVLAFVAEVS